jgi:hypothetical protein
MIDMIAMIGVDQPCARRKLIGARIGPIGPMCARNCARDCAWPCTRVDRPSQFLCMQMCTHAQNGFTLSLKQTECPLFHRKTLLLPGLMIALESLLASHPELQLGTTARLIAWAKEISRRREGGGELEGAKGTRWERSSLRGAVNRS